MGFFRRLLFFAALGATVYCGIKINIKDSALVSSLVPFLLLWVMFDVPHFLTLGLLDLSNAIFIIFKRSSISLPDNYRSIVLPTDVDDTGMMKQDKYVRNAGYAIRKLWLKTGLDKELSSAGFTLEEGSRSLIIKSPLGLLNVYKIRTQIVSIRDEVDSFFVEQKFLSGFDNNIHVISYIQFKMIDENAHLRRPDIGKINISKIFAHALTRKIVPPGSSSKTRKGKGMGKKINPTKAAEAEKILAEIASLSQDSSCNTELVRYIYHCCNVDKLSDPPQTPSDNVSNRSTPSSPASHEKNRPHVNVVEQIVKDIKKEM